MLVSALALGCAAGPDDETVETVVLDGREAEIAEITENLLAAGYTEEDIEVIEHGDSLSVAGVEVRSEGPQVFVEGDIHVTLEASRALLEAEGEDRFRHWRTPGLVTNNRTVCLVRALTLIPEIGPAVYGTLSLDQATGVQFARDNYNAIDIGLDFEIRDGLLDINGNVYFYAGDEVGCDFAIGIAAGWSGVGGSSGFPSGGAPYGFMLLSGTANNQVFEHIATHEIGHAIGLRHSDWMTRVSCGQNVNEGQLGASQIPGTAWQTTNSVFAACVPPGTNGEFRGEDVEALEWLY